MIALLLLLQTDGLDLFEKRVRPVLATECYSCHSAAQKKRKGNLVLDVPEGWPGGYGVQNVDTFVMEEGGIRILSRLDRSIKIVGA